MGEKRMVWHVGFGRLLRRRGSRSFDLREEVPLAEELPRMDFLLLLRHPAEPLDTSALSLRRLWPMLPLVSVVEYKSPGRPYRTGNLDQLWSYVHAYHAAPKTRPPERTDLCGVLVVPGRSPSLDDDVRSMGLRWEDLGGGYWEVVGGIFRLHVVEIDVVGPEEGDDVLSSMGSGKLLMVEARRFWTEIVGSQEAGMSMQDMEGYDELMKRLLETLPPERRLAGLTAEQVLSRYAPELRLAGLPPEQRLAGLDRDHQVLALSIELLRALPESYIRTLSAETQAEIQRRLRTVGH